jgi:hypothetical protein
MPFIGKTPAQGFVNSVTKDDFTPNGTTTAFTLSKAPATVNEIEVYVGNVRQEPTDAYSVSGTTLTMTEAPATGTNFYVMHIGGTTQSSTVVGDGTVTSAKLSGALTTPADLVVPDGSKLGVGNSTPARLLHLQLPSGVNGEMIRMSRAAGSYHMHLGVSSDSDMIVTNNGSTEILRIMNQGGISFDAGQTITDYEEGTFTPIYDNVTAPTYQAQTGKYIKIGKIVHVTGTITCTGLDTSDGSAVIITGFPFNVDTTNEAMNFNLGRYSSQLNGEEVDLRNVRAVSTGAMFLRSSDSSLSYNSGINANGTLQFAATYHAV